jgi:hypothetical protein
MSAYGGVHADRMAKLDKRCGKRRKWLWFIPTVAALLLCIAFMVYAERYYHADETTYPCYHHAINADLPWRGDYACH